MESIVNVDLSEVEARVAGSTPPSSREVPIR